MRFSMRKLIKYPAILMSDHSITDIFDLRYLNFCDYEFGIEFFDFIDKQYYLKLFVGGNLDFDLVNNIIHKFSDDERLFSKLSCSSHITEKFIASNFDNIDWNALSRSLSSKKAHTLANADFLETYLDKLNISMIVSKVHLEESFIIKHENKIDFKMLSNNGQSFSDEFYTKYKDKLCWADLVRYSAINEKVLLKYLFKMNLSDIVTYQNISDEFIIKYGNRINWNDVWNKNIAENVYIKFFHKLTKRVKQRIILNNIEYSDIVDMIGLDTIVKKYDYSAEFAKIYGLPLCKHRKQVINNGSYNAYGNFF